MHIVVRKEDAVVRSLHVDAAVVEIGSDPSAQVYLPDMRVAGRQAELRSMEGRCTLHPLDMAHATVLNCQTILEPAPIKDGDEIQMGDFLLRVYSDLAADTAVVKSAMSEELARIRQHPLPAGSVIRKEDPFTVRPAVKDLLADFAFRLHQATDFAKLLGLCQETLLKAFAARMAWMGIRRHDYGRLEFVEGKLKDGRPSGDPPILETYLYRCLERDQFIVVPRMPDRETQSAMAIPLITRRGRLGLIYLDSAADGVPYDLPQLDEFCMYGALIARQLEAVVGEQVHMQEAVAAGELSFVREIQARMDPTMVPQWEQLQLAVYCKPGLDRAGDVYDVMRLPNGLAAFLIAHAEASTTRAALAMAEVRAAFRMASMHADPPHVVLRALNWMVHAQRDPCLLHTAAIVMNPRTGACEYATAGLIGAMIVDRAGGHRLLADTSIPPLGQRNDYTLPSRGERLSDDETLVFYTPGCRTVLDKQGEPLGDERLVQALCDGFGQSAAEALNEVLSDLGAYFKTGRQPDDITMLVVHRI